LAPWPVAFQNLCNSTVSGPAGGVTELYAKRTQKVTKLRFFEVPKTPKSRQNFEIFFTWAIIPSHAQLIEVRK
jgi:hypothetical protein